MPIFSILLILTKTLVQHIRNHTDLFLISVKFVRKVIVKNR